MNTAPMTTAMMLAMMLFVSACNSTAPEAAAPAGSDRTAAAKPVSDQAKTAATGTTTTATAAAAAKPANQAGSAYARPGFVTLIEDGRLWVFKQDAKELAAFKAHGELAKHVIRPAAGPMGMTLKAPDTETIQAYVAAKPGFVTLIEDGRVWVFKHDAKELAAFKAHGELAKHVIRPAAGPMGMTIKAPNTETINAYIAARF